MNYMEIIWVIALSISINTLVLRYSAKRSLNLKLSIFKSSLIVTARSVAALAVGYICGWLFNTHVEQGTHLGLIIAQVCITILIALMLNFYFFNKASQKKLSILSVGRAMTTEFLVFFAGLVVLSVGLSVVFVLFIE